MHQEFERGRPEPRNHRVEREDYDDSREIPFEIRRPLREPTEAVENTSRPPVVASRRKPATGPADSAPDVVARRVRMTG